jgi:DNA mismatch repair protein MutL
LKRINVLDIETSNKIAAGEVVERPFSVVKELVENSLDANAKNIYIEISEGGQKLIKIIDDGDGIHPEDIEKAFLPHATSKINTINDIYKISSFGFRGEALASIAAISNINLKTRTIAYTYGKEIDISGGVINYLSDVGSNVGTTIEIKDLFFNVPARLKFMKSAQREAALITDVVERMALANHEVGFKVLSNNKKVISTYSSNNLVDTIRDIYGKTVCNNIMSLEKHSDIASVYGFIGTSEISRGSRNNQTIFVNKRLIKNKLITTAVENAFKSFLTINKFPFFIIFLDIFPDLIDVNVHPTKSEIKFNDDRAIFKLVFDAVHEALRKNLQDSFNVYSVPNDNSKDIEWTPEIPKKEKEVVQLPLDLNESIYGSPYKEDLSIQKQEKQIYNPIYNTVRLYEEIKPAEYNAPVQLFEKSKIPKFPYMTIIGQFNDTYILAQSGEELAIIDQHAAHEKIMFEKFVNSVENRSIVAQILSPPIVVELTIEDFTIYNENIEIFKRSGFNIEVFGENTISIREVPIILGNIEVKNLFIDILDNLKLMGTGNTVEVKYNKIASLSCKSAVKAKDKLSLQEMTALVEELRFIDNPFTCPHGRPTIIKITLNELEKRFKRIQ